MEWTDEVSERGVRERGFSLTCEGRPVPAPVPRGYGRARQGHTHRRFDVRCHGGGLAGKGPGTQSR